MAVSGHGKQRGSISPHVNRHFAWSEVPVEFQPLQPPLPPAQSINRLTKHRRMIFTTTPTGHGEALNTQRFNPNSTRRVHCEACLAMNTVAPVLSRPNENGLTGDSQARNPTFPVAEVDLRSTACDRLCHNTLVSTPQLWYSLRSPSTTTTPTPANLPLDSSNLARHRQMRLPQHAHTVYNSRPVGTSTEDVYDPPPPYPGPSPQAAVSTRQQQAEFLDWDLFFRSKPLPGSVPFSTRADAIGDAGGVWQGTASRLNP